MKIPRITDFDPDAKVSTLKSSLDNMPAIQKPGPNLPHKSPIQPFKKTVIETQTPVVKEKEKKQEEHKKSTSQQVDKSTTQQFSSTQIDISTKTSKRFTTYITKKSLKEIRAIATDEERYDYEIFQEAIDMYLAKRKK
jgi:hypothetical protein